jgi:hypothetical protein
VGEKKEGRNWLGLGQCLEKTMCAGLAVKQKQALRLLFRCYGEL